MTYAKLIVKEILISAYEIILHNDDVLDYHRT